MRESPVRLPKVPVNLPFPTLGGKQLWAGSRVEETRLSHRDEILTVASYHTIISNNTKAIAATLGFLTSDPFARTNSSSHAETGRNDR